MNTVAWRPSRVDAVLAAVMLLAGLFESYDQAGDGPYDMHQPLLWAAGAVVMAALTMVRLRVPVIAALTLSASIVVLAELDPGHPRANWQIYAMALIMYSLGTDTRVRSPRALLALTVVGFALWYRQPVPAASVQGTHYAWLFIAVPYVSGVLVRRQAMHARRLAERNTRLQAEARDRARRAVQDERARIAGELHDVISRNVSVMTLRAGGVRLRLTAEELDGEREMLTGIEEAGREAIAEMRTMLGFLDRPAGAAGGPGFAQFEQLVAQIRESGLDIRLHCHGEPAELPADLGRSAYRVIQEALTNALKHAGATRIDVTISYAPHRLSVEVIDDGTGAPVTQAAPSGGHGLVGMQERAALLGGELQAGPAPGGGFRVYAAFPLTDRTEPA